MNEFNFNCPKCRQSYCCNYRDKEAIFQCPQCRHLFIPADTLRKRCPACGEKISAHAIKCPYCGDFWGGAGKEEENHSLLKMILQLFVIAALIVGGVWGWKKFSPPGKGAPAFIRTLFDR